MKRPTARQRVMIDRAIAVLALIALVLLGANAARAQEVAAPGSAASAASAPAGVETPARMRSADAAPVEKTERLQITDPYIEMRTGPGRGYPVFFVVARAQYVEVELRHTDWFKVRTDDGKVGWVNRAQLESTLTASGAAKSFRDILIDDFLTRRVQLGAAWGQFKSEPMLKLFTSYRLSETLSLEGTLGQVQGVFSGTDFWHIGVMAEPWSDRRFSPFVEVGLGKFKNFPNLSLVNATTTDAKLAVATIGARYYLTDRFVIRADYSLYTAFVSDLHSTEYKALTAGLSFFF